MEKYLEYLNEKTAESIKDFYKGARHADPNFAKNQMKRTHIERILRYQNGLKELENQKIAFALDDGMDKYHEIRKHILSRIEHEKKLLRKVMLKTGAIGVGVAAVAAGTIYGVNKLRKRNQEKNKK
jgi:hypothetical protein